MPERQNIGEILLKSGRVTPADVTRALDYQREHGGFFGEALVALGMVKSGEVEWSLASQFDLPYVYPDADSIDPEAAALVTPEWALANLTLPIMKTADTLTVIVGSPLRSRALEELQARTDKTLQLALASPVRIREIVRDIFGRAAESPLEPLSSVTLAQGLRLALNSASDRFGVSVRGRRAWFWFDDAGTVRRRSLDGDWAEDLDRVVSPPLSRALAGEKRSNMEVEVTREGVVTPAELRYLSDENGREYLFRPSPGASTAQQHFPPPSPGLLTEVRLLARSAAARFMVRTVPPELGTEIVPHLPSLLLERSWRSVHVSDEPSSGASGAFSVMAPADLEGWSREADALRAFHFDAVTVDSARGEAEWALQALVVAPVAFIRWDEGASRQAAFDAGLRWELNIERTGGGRLAWALTPLMSEAFEETRPHGAD